MAELEVARFSGGMTDNYIGGPIDRFQEGDNLLLTDNDKLVTRPGSGLADATHQAAFPDSTRIGALPFQKDQEQEFAHIANKLYSKVSGTWTVVNGPTGNPAFGADTSTDHKVAWAEWNKHLFITRDDLICPVGKTYLESGTQKFVSAGLPNLASSPTVTAGAAGGNSYIYAFVHYRSYTIGSVTFEDFGAPTLVQLSSSAAPDATTVPITSIPTYANAAGENYVVSTDLKIKIYRTTSGGTSFFYIGQVNNGTSIYNDSKSDATIQSDNILLYTEGGVVDNDTPPKAKYLAVANDVMWYGHIKVGSVTYPNLLRHSVPGNPDAVPGSFEVEVKSEITGLGAVGKLPIVLCKDRIYRLDGFVDEFGRGVIDPVEIDGTVGCVSNLSIVAVKNGLFFAGDDGFYFTDGYRVVKVSNEINTTYATLVDTATKAGRIVGAYDTKNQRVWWTAQRDEDNSENDACFILDLNQGIKPDAFFSTASGEEHFKPTALCFDGTDIIRASAAGVCGLLRHNDDYTTDYDIANACQKTIIHTYKSCALSLGTTAVRKWVTKVLLSLLNVTNISLQPYSNNNNGQRRRALTELRFRQNIVWGDPSIVWGDDETVWNFGGVIERARRMPAGDLRATYKQVELTNAFTNVARSDDYGTATVAAASSTTKTAQIDIDWPDNSIDYYLTFANDSYEREYLITAHAGDTVTFTDASNRAPVGAGQEWLLKGYPKGEILHLLSYVLYYEPLSASHRKYHGAVKEGGGNT
jgi:hypothetical protein